MPTISFEGPNPIDLVARQQPVSSAERGIVAMTLPVSAVDNPKVVFQIRLLMTPEEADYVSAQLRPVVTTARMQARHLKDQS